MTGNEEGAALDFIAVDIGMTFLGGPLAFYELSLEEKQACLAWYLAKTDPELADKTALLTRAPLCGADLMSIASMLIPKKKTQKNVMSGLDYLQSLD